MILLQVNSDIFFTLLVVVVMMLVISGFTVYILLLSQKRKARLLRQQQEMKENYEKEILRTQIEIRDQAMNDVGRELHDHISQVMALVKLNVDRLNITGLDAVNSKRLVDTKDLVGEVINDIRMLSKTLNSELILQSGLVASIRHELERVNRLNIIDCRLKIEGDEYELPPNKAFVVFRIVQENLHNILKHAQCRNVLTKLSYTPERIILSQQDDGKGFNVAQTLSSPSGSGLINMQRRASLINAELVITSNPGDGAMLMLVIKNEGGKGAV